MAPSPSTAPTAAAEAEHQQPPSRDVVGIVAAVTAMVGLACALLVSLR